MVIYTLKSLETNVNCVTKCVTAQFYPLKVKIFKKKILKYIFRQIEQFFLQIWDHIIKTVLYTIFLCVFSILNSRISKHICKWRHKLQNIKKSVGSFFTWWNEAWPSCYGLGVMLFWRFGGNGLLNDWMNEWVTKVIAEQPRLHRVYRATQKVGF